MFQRLSKISLVYYTYLLGFLFYIHSYLPIYINSSFLERYVGSERVGILFSISAFLSLGGFVLGEKAIRKFGNFKTMLWGLILQFCFFLTLAFAKSPIILLSTFVLGQVMLRIILLNIDLFLESHSSNTETGMIRGVFLTITNVVVVLMPLVAGVLSSNSNYQQVYLLAAFSIIPVILLLLTRFRKKIIKSTAPIPFWQSIAQVSKNSDLRRIFFCNLLLRTFYAVMVIYLPIHLHLTLGFSWGEIGKMLSIMLLPFVLFELPLGRLADKKLGEKEILSAGILLTGLSTTLIYFISAPVFIAWTLILFTTRVGASAMEIMTETYFFKKVDAGESNIISLYRMVDSVGYIVGPILGSMVLMFFGTPTLFLILGLLVLLGLRHSLTLNDTL